jgi:hypothetical protein
MSSSQIITHKIGATFGYAGFKLLPAGTWSAKCQARDTDGNLVQDFDVALTPPVNPETRHAITIRAESDDTVRWVVGKLKCDVAFYDASSPPVVVPTNTFVIDVKERETHVG